MHNAPGITVINWNVWCLADDLKMKGMCIEVDDQQIWLDNGLCPKRGLLFMIFTCLSLYCGTTRSKKFF